MLTKKKLTPDLYALKGHPAHSPEQAERSFTAAPIDRSFYRLIYRLSSIRFNTT